MKTILATTDFSEYSLNAVEYAADFAVDVNAQLIILNAIPAPIAQNDGPMSENAIQDIFDASNRGLNELVRKIKLRTKEKISVSSHSSIGSAGSQIRLVADRVKPIAIVMGITPGKNFERNILGSAVFETINLNQTPVLIIPDRVSYQQIRKIGFASDLEKVSSCTPFSVIREWLAFFEASLNIVYVTLNHHEFASGRVSESLDLQNHFQSVDPVFSFVSGTNLSDELNEFAHKNALDLLIVVPKNHGISGILQHKHSRKLITHSKIPILAVHEVKADFKKAETLHGTEISH